MTVEFTTSTLRDGSSSFTCRLSLLNESFLTMSRTPLSPLRFLGFSGVESGTKQVKRCFAIGQNAQHPELAQHQDVDNATAVVEFVNGKRCVSLQP